MWGFWKILLQAHKAIGETGADKTLMLYKNGFSLLESLQGLRDPGVPDHNLRGRQREVMSIRYLMANTSNSWLVLALVTAWILSILAPVYPRALWTTILADWLPHKGGLRGCTWETFGQSTCLWG